MSISSSLSDCSSDLLCCEDAGIFDGDSPECSFPPLELPADIEFSIAGFVEEEGEYMPGLDYSTRFRSQELDSSAREESIAWILKVHAFYRFQPLTAYLSVNYMDRFLSSRRLPEVKGGEWPLQLLSVACLSLAAKMEETLVPSLLDFQIEDAKFIFEPKTIRRMELLVLGALNWRLRSITPFDFITFFAFKVDPTSTFIASLVSHATQIILTIIREINFIDYWPSSLAAAAILCAAKEIPNLSIVVNPGSAGSWCQGLNKDRIVSCYRRMVEHSSQRKPPRVVPQFIRVITLGGIPYDSTSSSLSSSSSPSSKRRKLNNNYSWVEDKDNPINSEESEIERGGKNICWSKGV
ncbi:cyclin-D1-1-like isoform X1 [Macadamia integrifolia]|uniref:cyclin-D1-1-like isoform X1 n=1 Tax=Macadamia integrifolia TaxID=60698 RepID=UPI001C4EFE83|nr:cyclin-D1-1-like isoform X1 [Macadamia integrifolia]